MNRLTLEEFKEAEKLPLIVVLDDVRRKPNRKEKTNRARKANRTRKPN